MTTIKRGTIRAYDSAQHEASVQVAGSLAVYLPAVPVATDIPAAAVVAGRECGIVFFTDDDPADAVVVTVHGASPPTTLIGDHTVDGDLNVTGDLDVDGKILGEGVSTAGSNLLDVGGGGTYTGRIGVHAGLGGALSASAGTLRGIGGFAIARSAGDTLAQGLSFAAGMSNIDLADAHAINTFGFVFGSGKTLTNYVHHHYTAVAPILATITNNYGSYHRAITAGTNRRHVYAEDIAGGTIARFVEYVNALIVKASGEYTKAANQTPLFIYEGATPTLRQVQWKDGAAIAGGDRVMVLV